MSKHKFLNDAEKWADPEYREAFLESYVESERELNITYRKEINRLIREQDELREALQAQYDQHIKREKDYWAAGNRGYAQYHRMWAKHCRTALDAKEE